MNFVLFFNEKSCENIVLSGGKGSNLSKLTNAGFNVPNGFVVSSDAYKEFIKQATFLEDSIKSFDYENPEILNRQTLELKSKLMLVQIPSEIQDAIYKALEQNSKSEAYSVRSSSTMEDLSGAAFAGQHDTFLNCVGKDEIIAKVKECFISLWHDRAVAYRKQKGFSKFDATMAVVVQKMVQADSAGVGFSINPINGNMEEVLINSNFGLGESVVSGESTVDQFTVSKKDLVIKDAVILEKNERVLSLAQGTETVKLSKDEALKPSISNDQVVEIAKLNILAQNYYGFPQDIEWAIENNILYLLQSRPITTLPAKWTRDESAERYPSVITPFTWDFVEKGFHISLDHSFKIMGLPLFEGKWFAIFDNYVYGNQNAVWLYMGQMPLVIKDTKDLISKIPYIKERFGYIQELPITWMRDLDTYLLNIGALMSEDLEGKTEQEVWDFITRTTDLGFEYFKPNIAISITQSLLYKAFMFILNVIDKDQGKSLFDALISTSETKTALVNTELYFLAGMIKDNEDLNRVVHENNSIKIIENNLLAKFVDFNTAFNKFLLTHGHRETEFDTYIPTWIDAPNVVLDNLRLIVDNFQNKNPKDKEYTLKKDAQDAETKLFAKSPKELHLFLYELLRLVRVYTSLDDLEHYQTMRLSLLLRKGAKALGGLLKKKNIVDDEMDIFFAHINTMNSYINGQISVSDLKQEILQEKIAYLKNKERTPDWILGSNDIKETNLDNLDVLNGIAGGPGMVEGEVFIIRSTEDFSLFPKNSILVARTTNPAWTPLFYNARGVITESGGALSHGAVTAREMKLPAVMSVRNVLQKLKNGQRVRVDGTNGKVYILDVQ